MSGLKTFVLCTLLAFGITANVGCQEKGPAEKAGEKVDNAVEKTGEGIKDAGESVKDAAK